MPKPGLSLVGFISDAEQAIDYLRHDCVPLPGQESEDMLLEEWHAARAKIGLPFPNAGDPEIQPIPKGFQPYIDKLMRQPWVEDRLRDVDGASFQIVEIDSLLANQFAINKDRAAQFGDGLSGLTFADLLEICLPMKPPPMDYQTSSVSSYSTSVMLKSHRRDFTFRRFGVFNSERAQLALVGARLELPLPFVHVVRLDGRCYLHNGYHRVYGARLAGVTHLPCFFRDALDLKASGLPDDGSTLPPSLLASDNPPTVAHYTQGRAYEVALRAKLRVIHVSWHQYLVDAE